MLQMTKVKKSIPYFSVFNGLWCNVHLKKKSKICECLWQAWCFGQEPAVQMEKDGIHQKIKDMALSA